MPTNDQVLSPLINAKTQEEANVHFERLVKFIQDGYGKSRKEAEESARKNIGYYAGYFSEETQERVKKFYNAPHPGFKP